MAARGTLGLTAEEVGVLSEGLSFASRPFHGAIEAITAEFDLGPRGPWILVLIDNDQASYPLEFATFFRTGRSLITAELTRLSDAGLIEATQNNTDRRRTRFTLTPAGKALRQRVKEALTQLVGERFKGYTREELLLCSRMLHDFRNG